jgi:hypothetical protein
MAKKPAPRKTVEQLKSMVWPTQEAAIADIKISKVTLTDGELREYRPGSWQIMPIDAPPAEDDYMPKAQDREQTVIDSLRKKPGAAPKGAPEVIAHAKAPARKREAAAAIDGNGKRDHREVGAKTAPPVPKKAAAKQPRPQPGVVAIAPKAMEAAAPELTPAPIHKPAVEGVPLNLGSPLPREGRPYSISIIEGGSPGFPNHTAHTTAIDVSRKLGAIAQVHDKDGLIVRTYDWQKMKISAKEAAAKKRAANPALPKVGRKASGESQFARAIRLLERKEGATAAQLEKEIGWVSVTQRYANRAAVISGSTVEVLGEKHWRLKKRS